MQLAEIGRRQQLTDRAPAPRPARTSFIPNGPFSSPPANPPAAAAAVSFTAQYRMVYADRRLAVVAGLKAAIPDAAALVFACLGVTLALRPCLNNPATKPRQRERKPYQKTPEAAGA